MATDAGKLLRRRVSLTISRNDALQRISSLREKVAEARVNGQEMLTLPAGEFKVDFVEGVIKEELRIAATTALIRGLRK
jgi:hypothetical protein